jgi:hypothetical protein
MARFSAEDRETIRAEGIVVYGEAPENLQSITK